MKMLKIMSAVLIQIEKHKSNCPNTTGTCVLVHFRDSNVHVHNYCFCFLSTKKVCRTIKQIIQYNNNYLEHKPK